MQQYAFCCEEMAAHMKILCVNTTFSIFGGIEFAAMNLALGLLDRGHEVHFLATRGDQLASSSCCCGAQGPQPPDKLKIHHHFREFPRTYSLGESRGVLQKLFWHIQDVCRPANEAIFAEVLHEVEPDIVILHNITNIGLNIWRTLRQSKTPCLQVIHDLSLICLNMARFKNGRQCAGLCAACRLQKSYRFSLLDGSSNFAFVSPSRATLEEVERYVDLSAWRRQVISNPNVFRVKPRNTSNSAKPRLLYVGRLDPFKGVNVMLEAASRAHHDAEFELDILGTGSLESSLRKKYAGSTWIRIHGNVDQETVADFMSRASVLLVPSLWLETVPGVAVHALFAGLPVLGSRVGGIPEHVVDRETGRLLTPGDERAWAAEIARVVSNSDQVATWSAACRKVSQRFDPQIALDAYEKLMESMVDARSGAPSKEPLN
jgi:glycosyltransferase involved in cell wall biosynthesis